MVITLFCLLCNLSYRMQFLPSLNGGGLTILNKYKKVEAEQLLQCWWLLGQMSLNFLRFTIFPEKLEFNKKWKHFSYIVQSCMYLTKLFAHALLILWIFVKMTFTSLFLPTLVIIPYLLSLFACPSKKYRKTLYGEGIRLEQLTFFSFI